MSGPSNVISQRVQENPVGVEGAPKTSLEKLSLKEQVAFARALNSDDLNKMGRYIKGLNQKIDKHNADLKNNPFGAFLRVFGSGVIKGIAMPEIELENVSEGRQERDEDLLDQISITRPNGDVIVFDHKSRRQFGNETAFEAMLHSQGKKPQRVAIATILPKATALSEIIWANLTFRVLVVLHD